MLKQFRTLSLLLFGGMLGYYGMSGNTEKVAKEVKSESEKPAGGAADISEDVWKDCRALKPLGDLLQVDKPTCPSKGVSKDWADSLAKQQVKKIEVIIATIPDPDTISFARFTSQALESIQLAAEKAGYSQIRHWLPWFEQQPKASRAAFEPRSHEPGILIFQKDANTDIKDASLSHNMLLVLVVGETPTYGVDRAALTKAIKYNKWLQTKRDAEAAGLRILGPTFSGSADGIASTIRQTRPSEVPKDKYRLACRVVSGSATNGLIMPKLNPEVQFSSVVENDAAAKEAFRKFWTKRGSKQRQAFVGESGSFYGEGLRGEAKEIQTSKAKASQDSEVKAEDSKTKDALEQTNGRAYQFPMHISQL